MDQGSEKNKGKWQENRGQKKIERGEVQTYFIRLRTVATASGQNRGGNGGSFLFSPFPGLPLSFSLFQLFPIYILDPSRSITGENQSFTSERCGGVQLFYSVVSLQCMDSWTTDGKIYEGSHGRLYISK